MPTPVASPKEALRAISVFFYAMIGGLLILSMIVFTLSLLEISALEDRATTKFFFIVVLFLTAVLLTAAARTYPKRITLAHTPGLSLMDKLNIYRASLIFYLALCEGAGLFAIIVYFLTGQKLLLIVVAIVLLTMLLKRPKKSKIFNELQLSTQEQLELN